MSDREQVERDRELIERAISAFVDGATPKDYDAALEAVLDELAPLEQEPLELRKVPLSHGRFMRRDADGHYAMCQTSDSGNVSSPWTRLSISDETVRVAASLLPENQQPRESAHTGGDAKCQPQEGASTVSHDPDTATSVGIPASNDAPSPDAGVSGAKGLAARQLANVLISQILNAEIYLRQWDGTRDGTEVGKAAAAMAPLLIGMVTPAEARRREREAFSTGWERSNGMPLKLVVLDITYPEIPDE